MGSHVASLGHIIMIPNQPVFVFSPTNLPIVQTQMVNKDYKLYNTNLPIVQTQMVNVIP
jgi:hypothetical protein